MCWCPVVVVVLEVHDHHGHPFVCCEYHPITILFELSEGYALCCGEVAMFMLLLLLFEKPVYIRPEFFLPPV